VQLINKLGLGLLLPRSLMLHEIPLSRRVDVQTGSWHGGVVTSAHLEPRKFEIRGSIWNPDRVALQQELDALLGFLAYSPIKIYPRHAPERFITAEVRGAPYTIEQPGTEYRIDIPLIAVDPHWYSQQLHVAPVETSESGLLTTNDGHLLVTEDGRPLLWEEHVSKAVSTAATLPVTTQSSVNVHPVLKLTAVGGAVAHPILTNETTGQVLGFVGDIPAGQSLIVDAARMTAQLNGQGVLNSITESFLTDGFTLIPHLNEVRVSIANPGGGKHLRVEIEYRDKWL